MQIQLTLGAPQLLERKNDERKPCRLDYRHDYTPVAVKLACSVDSSSLQQCVVNLAVMKFLIK